MTTGDPNTKTPTDSVSVIHRPIGFDRSVGGPLHSDSPEFTHDKLLKKYSDLEAIADAQALSLISLKKAIEEPGSPQARRGYPHYLQLVFENLNRYLRFKTKYNPKPKNEIESETA
jgi:hypothetical protein